MSIDRAKIAKQAENYLASGRAGKAIDEFLKLLEDNPKDLNLTNRLGDIFLQENRLEEAIDMFKRAAVGFDRDGFLNKAIAIFKKAMRCAPENIDVVSRLLDLYKRSNMVREAIQVHLHLADSYIKKGLTPRALSEFTKIVELEPKNIKNKLRLAELCQMEGQKEQAADIYLEAAQLLIADNLHAEANQVIEKAKTLISSPKIFRAQADLCARQSDLGAAKERLDEGLKTNPKDADLLNDKAKIELHLNQPLAALQILASIPQLSDNSLPICQNALQMCLGSNSAVKGIEIIGDRMEELARRGFGDFAKLTLYNALETQPIPEYWLLLAQIAHQNGARAEQVECLKYALTILPMGDNRSNSIRAQLQGLGVDPNDPSALAIKAPPNIVQQSSASVRLERQAEIDPRQSMQIRQMLKEAQQLESDSKTDKAIETYQRLLEIDPTNSDAILRIAELHKSSGMVTKAQVHFCKTAEKLASLGKPELALKYLDMAEAIISGSTRATRLMLGDALIVPPPLETTYPAPDVSVPPLDEFDTTALPPLELDAKPKNDVIPLGAGFDASPAEFSATDLGYAKQQVDAVPPSPVPIALPPNELSQSGTKDATDFPSDLDNTSDLRIAIPDLSLPLMDDPSLVAEGISDTLRQTLCSIDFQMDYGSPFDAKVDIERALSMHPNHPELLKRLESIEEKLRNQGAGIEPKGDETFDLSDMLSLSLPASQPLDEINDNTAEAARIKSPEEIFNAFKDEVAQQVGGDDYDTNYNLGIGYKEMLLLDPAIEEFKKAMRDPERTIACCSMIAMCEESKGDTDSAIWWLHKGIDAPGFPPIDSIGLRHELGNLLKKVGRHQEAEVQLQEVELLQPGYGG